MAEEGAGFDDLAAEAVREALDATAVHDPDPEVLIAGARERAGRRRHRRRVVWFAAAVGAVGLVAIAAVVMSLSGGPAPSISATTTAALVGPADVALCRATDRVDRRSVRRTDFPGNHVRYLAPAAAVVDQDASVRAVAVALCGLPVSLAGVAFCAVDLGIAYHLTFTIKGKAFPTVIVRATGCSTVSGVGKTRWGPDPVWVALGKALHLRPPYDEAFRGEPPSGP